MDDCCSRKSAALDLLAQGRQRRVLIVVMAINLAMFATEFGFGLIARSTAMMADSVDMLGDAIVYALSLYALARNDRWKAGAALAKGVLIFGFGLSILIESGWNVVQGTVPNSDIMLVVTGIALAANLVCLALLWRFRSHDVNMASSFECSRNDVMANAGVLIAGGLVAWFASPWPDLVVGVVIAALFLRSAVRVLQSAWPIWMGHPGNAMFD